MTSVWRYIGLIRLSVLQTSGVGGSGREEMKETDKS